MQSEDGPDTDRAQVVILGNNNVVGDGNVVVGGECSGELTERQRQLMECLPNLDEEMIRELCRMWRQCNGVAS